MDCSSIISLIDYLPATTVKGKKAPVEVYRLLDGQNLEVNDRREKSE